MKKAFTLIELLVVVLIIGILSAIALPQYQFAVEKSRATQALIMVRAIADANRRYYLANGDYTWDISLLDIDIPGEDHIYAEMPRKKNQYFDFGARVSSKTDASGSIAISNRLPYNDEKSYYLVAYADGHITCAPNDPSYEMARRICKALGADSSSVLHF